MGKENHTAGVSKKNQRPAGSEKEGKHSSGKASASSTAKNVLVQGTILAAASIIARVIGLIYRIPLTRILGDEGNSYYSTANEIYSIILMISSFSLPLAVSRLMSERLQKGETRSANKVFLCAMRFAVTTGLILALLTYLFAGVITKNVMNIEYAKYGLRVLAPAILIYAITGTFRGFFQGFSNMVPTALSQLIEQIVNAVVSLYGAYSLYDYGRTLASSGGDDSLAPAWGAAGATFGTVASVSVAMVVMMVMYVRFSRDFRRQIREDHTGHRESYRSLYRLLILTITPIVLSTLVYNISNVVDQGIFNAILKSQGYSQKQYATIWGIYSGKFRVLMNVPLALASSLGPAVVPNLTAAMARGDRKAAVGTVRSSTRYTMIITIPCALGMAALGGPIMEMLFHPSSGVPLAAGLMQAGVPVIILYSLSTLTTSILQGLGKLREPLIHCIAALGVHIVSLVIMLRMGLNIYAVMYANCIFALIVCVLNALAIARCIQYRQEFRRTFFVPAAASVIMAFAAYLVYQLLHLFCGVSVSTVLSILAGIIVYGIALVSLKGMTRDEIEHLPKVGKHLVKIFEKLGLLH